MNRLTANGTCIGTGSLNDTDMYRHIYNRLLKLVHIVRHVRLFSTYDD